MIELLLAVVVGVMVLAGAYTSYELVARQYDKLSVRSQIQERGLPAIRLITRDLRMAGHKELDANLNSTYGMIASPVVITDSGGGCCDSVQIIYDKDMVTRERITYRAAQRNSPTRTALFMDTETWNGAAWTLTLADALVADYVEDFQLSASNFNSDGKPMLIDFSLVLRGKEALEQSMTYATPAYNPGNSTLNVTDHYFRDTFTATVNLRNIQ